MERPEFDITIGKDGKVTVEVKGTSGTHCMELADLIKEIIGQENQRRVTAEFYAPDGRVKIDTKVNRN